MRQKCPSSQALEALAGSDTPPACRRRATGRTPSSSSAEPAPLAANHLVSTRGEVGNTHSDPVLPTGFLDQVVARVTTEVTRQLQPLLSGSSAMQSDITLSTESAPSQHGPPASQAPAFVQPSVLATASQGQTEVPVVGHPIQRGTGPGPIFITVDGLPVSRSKFSQHPSRAIQLWGLAPSRYKGHSFHIGAASHAVSMGSCFTGFLQGSRVSIGKLHSIFSPSAFL